MTTDSTMQQIRSVKTRIEQWEVLVDFLIEHPEMVSRSFVGLDAREHYKRLWEQISVQLNSMGYGSKSVDKWIDAFTKWKSKVKVKAQNIVLGMKKTGGGGPVTPLSSIEEKLMGIMGWMVVKGDATLELGLDNSIVMGSESEQTLENLGKLNMVVPPLAPIINKAEATISIDSLPSTSSAVPPEKPIDTGKTCDSTPVRKNGAGGKRNLASIKPKKTFNRINKKFDDMTLLRMHQETMSILNEINKNLCRVADCAEAFLKKE